MNSIAVFVFLIVVIVTHGFQSTNTFQSPLKHNIIINNGINKKISNIPKLSNDNVLKMSSESSTSTIDSPAPRDKVPFEIRGFSLPVVAFSVGFILIASSFASFFGTEGNGEGAISSLGFVYGIPVLLIGLSLWYAEIPPVKVISDEAGDRAWNKKATETLIKVKQDVTRHRYGDDAHLDSTLDFLGLKLQGKKYPRLQSLTQEEAPNGELVFTLTFQSADTPYKLWAEPDRVARYAKFFGPQVTAEVVKVDAEKRLVAIRLTTYQGDVPPPQSSAATVESIKSEESADVKVEA